MQTRAIPLAGLGSLCLGLGVIGLLWPAWPTAPFIFVSIACFASTPYIKARMRGIPRLMKRSPGTIEAIFDMFYLGTASILGLILLLSASGSAARALAGVMALVLVGGDAFHLIPRIIAIKSGKEENLRRMLGRGKQLTSITMSVFYLFLWQIGTFGLSPEIIRPWGYAVYALAAMRIFLCLLPQNQWEAQDPSPLWGIVRNIPFLIQGMMVAGLFFVQRGALPGLSLMWLAIALSFAFYLPVVLWVRQNPKIGMLMLPKTCAYLWMLVMCLSL